MKKYQFTKQHVIGFHGAQGSGKDTLAEGIKEAVDWCTIQSLAGPLKFATSRLFCCLDHSHLYGSQAEKDAVVSAYGLSGRKILQKMGDFSYQVDPDTFSRALAEKVKRRHPVTVLVPDFRRPSEFDYDYGCPKIIIGLTRNMHQAPAHHTDHLMFNRCDHVVHNANITKEETLLDAIEFLLRHGAIREL